MVCGRVLGCHQRYQRSFFIKGYQMPICSRCLGIYIGNITALILVILNFNLNIIIATLLLIPLILDGIFQIIKANYFSTNLKRLITGLLFGLSIIYLINDLIKLIFNIV